MWFRGDPTARPRKSADEALRDAQQIISLHDAGWTVRPIARELGLSRSRVQRVIQEYEAALDAAEVGDVEAEAMALISKYGEEGALHAPNEFDCPDDCAGPHVERPEQIRELNPLHYFRMATNLPADDPVRGWHRELLASGWWPEWERA